MVTAYFKEIQLPGLIFCVAIYICIILTRTISAMYFKNLVKATYLVGGLEYFLAIWGSHTFGQSTQIKIKDYYYDH